MPHPVSSANFLGHPIDPMSVLFPVAFFLTSFLWREPKGLRFLAYAGVPRTGVPPGR